MADKESNLYNIRIIKAYIELLVRFHPDIDLNQILKHANISKYELEDLGTWISQEQADRFYEEVVRQTGDPDIARKAGRYATSSIAYGTIRQYVFGFFTPGAAYNMLEKIGSKVTRGGTFKTTKLGTNRFEITSTPADTVEEKPFQCENRLGMLEALGAIFTGDLPEVDHPECFHQGGDCCRYIIEVRDSPSLRWKRWRNWLSILGGLGLFLFIALAPNPNAWLALLFFFVSLVFGFSLYGEILEKKEIARNLDDQGNTAEQLLDEINMRYNDAILVQEIGQAISQILEVDELISSVVSIMEKRLIFDRGMIMLSVQQKTRLVYSYGYGYEPEQGHILKKTEFRLDNPDSQGIFVQAFQRQIPFLIEDIKEVEGLLSENSRRLAENLKTNAFICVPIVFENESLGIIAVDNVHSQRPLTQSDVSLLMGIAPQIAVSIHNARYLQKLQASEEKYRQLVENAHSIIMRMDPNGEITFFNEFGLNFFGYSEKELLGRRASETILSNGDGLPVNFEKMLEEIEHHPEKYANIESMSLGRDDQKVYIAWTHRPIWDHDGRLKEILAIGNDITGLKKAAEERRELEEQLQQAQKMEMIGTLAGGVAHDLNNILGGIMSYPELLLLDLPEDSPLRGPLMTIQKSGQKAAATVSDLLTLARRGVAVTEVVDLNSVISDYFTSPEHNRLTEGHPFAAFELCLDPRPLYLKGSEVHLGKSAMNVIANAAESLKKPGKVTVVTEKRFLDRPVRGYERIPAGEYVVMIISDEGQGISALDQKRLFEPFYTRKSMGKSGTGLGLSVVWATVKDHKGYIDLESSPGQGTRVCLYFPAAEGAPKVLPETVDWEKMGGREKILVVDDISEQRDLATGLLARLGYDVDVASSGEEAVDYIKNQEVDLLLLDIIMDPGIDGLETYKQILKIREKQKAIVVSGFSETDQVREAINLGAGTYVRKPYQLDELVSAVRTELDR